MTSEQGRTAPSGRRPRSPPARPRYRVARPKTRLGQLGLTVAAIVGGAYVIVIAAAPLELSRRFLPEPLHLAVLVVYAARRAGRDAAS